MRADEKTRDFLDRLLRGRKADPLESASARVIQPLEREREMRAATRFQHGVDLVDDHDARRLQHVARAFGSEQQVERLGGRDQDVRRPAQHARTLVLGRIAAAHGGADAHGRVAHLLRETPDLTARLREVLVYVGRQRFQRRPPTRPSSR